jgi:hypothetical protein
MLRTIVLGILRDQSPFIQFSCVLCSGCSLFIYLIINYVNIQWCRYAHLILQAVLTHPEILVSIMSNCLPLAYVKDGCSSFHIKSMKIGTASCNNSPTNETCIYCSRCWKKPLLLHTQIRDMFIKHLHSCIVVIRKYRKLLCWMFSFSFSIVVGFGL